MSGIMEPLRRLSVVGNSGSGKRVLGRHIADVLDVPYVESRRYPPSRFSFA